MASQSSPLGWQGIAKEKQIAMQAAASINRPNPSEMWSAAQRNYDPGPQYKPNVTGGKYVGNAGQTPSSTFQTHKPTMNPQSTPYKMPAAPMTSGSNAKKRQRRMAIY